MKCMIHRDKDAISSCINCGQGLCEECAVEVSRKFYCRDCLRSSSVLPPQRIYYPPEVIFKQEPSNNLGLIGTIVGLIGIFFLGFILGTIAIILGVMALDDRNDDSDLGWAAIILGIIGFIIWLVILILILSSI